jgi:undecaprenyl diphosphate synthase
MKNYRSLIDLSRVPTHVAIIMDGNGRWAKKKSLPRIEGHRMGAEVIEPLMDTALSIGIKVISLYAFSTENWARPKSEIEGLWRLLEYFFKSKIDRIKEKGIRIKHSGSLKNLPATSSKIIKSAIEKTKNNRSVILNFCLNYGSRQEIVYAVNSWLEGKKAGEKLTIDRLDEYLYTSDLPDVDLLIRTSGEFRISNFLLWQSAYAELVFLEVLWPDFRPYHLYKAIYEYQKRERRFGGL